MIVLRPFKLDRQIILAELRMPLIGQRAMKAVPTIDTLPERPVVMGPSRTVVRYIGQVPFADRVARIGVRTKYLRNHGGLPSNLTAVSGKAARPLGDNAHAHRVGVAAREQTGPRRRTHRGNVKIGKRRAFGGQSIHARCRNLRTVAAEIRVADVVQHDEYNVRRTFRRRWRVRPPWLGIAIRPPYRSLETRAGRSAHARVSFTKSDVMQPQRKCG